MRIPAIIEANRPTFSVEFFPPKTDEGREQMLETASQFAEIGLDFVSITYGAGGSTREGTVAGANLLHNEFGFETMAHLSCVGETVAGLRSMLDDVREIGVENVLALRGDPPRGQTDFVQPEGGLGSAAELAGFISENYEFAIASSCFPEVHPEAVDLDADLDYLKTKVENGAEFLITQLFFDNQVYFDFVATARAKGIGVPIIPGVIPVASYAQTAKICSLCDATIPQPLADAFAALDGDKQAEFELGVAYAAQQSGELLAAGAPGIQFYALNKAPATRAVISALRAARPWEQSDLKAATSQA
jgi:methylenetetrahydrofolate reductase (NADPH)